MRNKFLRAILFIGMIAMLITGCKPNGTSSSISSQKLASESLSGDGGFDFDDSLGIDGASGGSIKKNTEEINPVAKDGTKVDLKGKKIVILANTWVDRNDKNLNPVQKRILNRLKEIENNFNCIIDFQQINWSSFMAKFNSGQLYADIVTMSAGTTYGYFNSNSVVALDGLGIDYKKYDEKAVNMMTYQGKHFGLKKKNEGFEEIEYASAMFMNKTLIKQYSKTNPDDIYKWALEGTWTWSKFESIVKEIARDTNNDGKNDIYGALGQTSDNFLWLGLISSNGGQFTKNEKGILSMSSFIESPAMEAMNFFDSLTNLKSNSARPPVYCEIGAQGNANLFQQSKAAFVVDYYQRLNASSYGSMKDEIGVVPVPKGPKASQYSGDMTYYEGWAIPKIALKQDQDGTYFKQLGAVLQALCMPFYDSSSGKDVLLKEIESYSPDKGTFDVMKMMIDKNLLTYTYDYTSPRFYFHNNIFMGKIVTGDQAMTSAIASNLNSLEKYLQSAIS